MRTIAIVIFISFVWPMTGVIAYMMGRTTSNESYQQGYADMGDRCTRIIKSLDSGTPSQ
jgi:hypothetical protein